MKINGNSIAAFNARQLTTEYGFHSTDDKSEWPYAATLPYLSPLKIGFKPLKAVLVVKGANRETIRKNCSDILSVLVEPATLKLDGRDHLYKGTLKKYSVDERAMHRYHLLTLEFDGYEYADQDPVTGTSSVTIVNSGNLISPCRVEITPTVGVASITLTGLCRDSFSGEDMPVTLVNLQTGKTVVLDGVTGEISQDGKIKEVNMWRLPSLLPGSNVITCSSEYMQITVKTTALFM